MRAYLSLGSNLGDRRAHLKDAIVSIDGVVAVSDVYRTAPVGGPDQDDYFNLIVAVDTELSPRGLLDVCHRLESAAGRVRGVRWGPRTLDVDIVWCDGEPVDEPDLQIPHPRMRRRRFVMEPLGELAPDLLSARWRDEAEGDVERLGPL
jgi:2-amino-4-hydroxy-6-hydroxymethyldihydropteridine diphosphokinase